MGYSEIRCYICGVSFNIGRVRKKGEPRKAAWGEYGTSRLGTTYTEAGGDHHESCMVAYREDSLEYSRWNPSEEAKIMFAQSVSADILEVEILSDGMSSVDFVPADELRDELYEYNTPNESDVEFDDEEMTVLDERESIDGVDRLYHAFLRSLRPATERPVNSETMKPFLPKYAEDYNQPTDGVCSTFDRDSARKAKEMEELEAWLSSDRDPTYHSKCDDRRLYDLSGVWEHIAGPSCTSKYSTGAYNGNYISAEEMAHCSTSQCLVLDPGRLERSKHPSMSFVPDEPIEHTAQFFLSGLSDLMPSRDIDTVQFVPQRYTSSPLVDTYMWGDDQYSLPFHPTCLEVLKRASLHRSGCIDLQGVRDAWCSGVEALAFDSIPRDEAVKRASEQWWVHQKGDEWLAANSCLIPGLPSILAAVASPDKGGSNTNPSSSSIHHSERYSSIARTVTAPDPFLELPEELLLHILSYLPAVSAASLALSTRHPTLHPLPQMFFKNYLAAEHAYLWELWSTLPYSGWSLTTEQQLTAAIDDRNSKLKIARWVLQILEEEGRADLHSELLRYWFGNTVGIYKTSHDFLPPILPAPTEPLTIIHEQVDYHKLANLVARGFKDGTLKGLRNRRRIWTDCNYILGEVEKARREGLIEPISKIDAVDGKWVEDEYRKMMHEGEKWRKKWQPETDHRTDVEMADT